MNTNNLDETVLKKKLYDLLEGFGIRTYQHVTLESKNRPLDNIITTANFKAVNWEMGIADHQAQLIFYEFIDLEKQERSFNPLLTHRND